MRNGCETDLRRFILKQCWVQISSVHLHPFRTYTPSLGDGGRRGAARRRHRRAAQAAGGGGGNG
eukprot:5581344-Prymnesium_polylepis.1